MGDMAEAGDRVVVAGRGEAAAGNGESVAGGGALLESGAVVADKKGVRWVGAVVVVVVALHNNSRFSCGPLGKLIATPAIEPLSRSIQNNEQLQNSTVCMLHYFLFYPTKELLIIYSRN